MLFNGLVLNADAHLKNSALLHDQEGGIRIAPLYDILCTACILMREGGSADWEREPMIEMALERQLALCIGEAETIDDLRDEHWLDLGQRQMGLSRRYAQRALDEVRAGLLESLRPTADRLLNEDPGAEQAIEAVRSAIANRHG